MRPSSLAARDVSLRFRDVVALDHASIEVAAGDCVALVGESGAGKSTLLRCFNRMAEPDAGVVAVDSADVRSLPAVELRRRIGYVPQHGGLLPHWRVLRNTMLVPVLRGMGDAEDAAADALELVGLPVAQFGRRFPHELSGGQRQRVALARALAARPGVILMDEPFGALDAITRSDLQGAFERVRAEVGVTTLLVTHDVTEAARLASELVVMRAGRVEQRAALEGLMSAPASSYVAELIQRALAPAARLLPSV